MVCRGGNGIGAWGRLVDRAILFGRVKTDGFFGVLVGVGLAGIVSVLAGAKEVCIFFCHF